MTLSNAEQYLLELMNRARLDPAGEAARMGINLNKDLPAGTISNTAKQVLAPNDKLDAAATGHSLWMLAQDVFSHTGAGGSNGGQRITAQGYTWWGWGENLAMVGSTATVTIEGSIEKLNTDLFLSATHRTNLMKEKFQEVGIGAEVGKFQQGSTNFNTAMLTENFGYITGTRFLTGVSYTDSNANNFYTMGEGKAGVNFTIGNATTTTSASGGYSLQAGTAAVTAVSGVSGTLAFSANVDMSIGNVKLDLVSDVKFMTSGSITLVSGIRNVDLLGVANLNAEGNAAGNRLVGNAGNNLLTGRGGNDTIVGGLGADTLTGGLGNDVLTGEAGSDTFVFSTGLGSDRIVDFRKAQLDHISLDHGLWTGTKTAAQVVTEFAHIGTNEVFFDFGGSNQIHLTGLTSLSGLDATLIIV